MAGLTGEGYDGRQSLDVEHNPHRWGRCDAPFWPASQWRL